MGQVERYGLYVLVLFIFLILGVAIWGDEPRAANRELASSGAAAEEVTDLDDSPTLIDQLDESRNRALLNRFDPDEFDDELVDSVDDEAGTDVDVPVVKEGDDPVAEPARRPDPRIDYAPRPALREYTIRKGDTLSAIAQRALGSSDESEWRRIIAINPDLDPNRLREGRVIRLPHRQEVVEAIRRADKGLETDERVYVVRKGDSLSMIAMRELGSVRHVKAIMKRNGITKADSVRAGKEIILPVVERD